MANPTDQLERDLLSVYWSWLAQGDCSCGGLEPGDPDLCSACRKYHRIMAEVRRLRDALKQIEEIADGSDSQPAKVAEMFAVAMKARGGTTESQAEEPDDICGFCGKPGADKIPHPVRWPGEELAGTKYVHAECEDEECRRAHALLTDEQQKAYL